MPGDIFRLGDFLFDKSTQDDGILEDCPPGSDVFVVALPPPVSAADLAFATSHWADDSTVVPDDANDSVLKTACLELATAEVVELTNKYLKAKKFGIVEGVYYRTAHSFWMVLDTFPAAKEWPESVPYLHLAALGRHEYERRQRGEPRLWADKQLPRWRIRRLPTDPSAYPMHAPVHT